MKTKAEVVQGLLDAGHINAEDAVVLLTGSKEKEYVYLPQPYPVYPNYPTWWYVNPFPYSTTTGVTTVTATLTSNV